VFTRKKQLHNERHVLKCYCQYWLYIGEFANVTQLPKMQYKTSTLCIIIIGLVYHTLHGKYVLESWPISA